MLPPYLAESNFPAGMLMAMMDANGVDRAIVLQNPFYGIMNEEISKAVKENPDRLTGTIQVDPFDKNALEIIRTFNSPGQSVLKFEMSDGWGWTGIYRDVILDSSLFMDFWQLASELGMQVIIDPGPIDNPGYQVKDWNG
jgi:predicted TIM-barrel fold metal-dependent hydrolase